MTNSLLRIFIATHRVYPHPHRLTTHLSCLAAMTNRHVQISLSKIKLFLILKLHTTASSSTAFSHSHRLTLVNIRKNVVRLSECATQLILQPPDISRLDYSSSLLPGLLTVLLLNSTANEPEYVSDF